MSDIGGPPVSDEGPSRGERRRASGALLRRSPLTWLLRGAGTSLIPHPVLEVRLRELLEGPGLERTARPAGWQFILPRHEPTAVELIGSLEPQIERGPQVTSALDVFRGGPPWGASQLTPWLLRVPEVGLAAVWFRSPDEDDVVVPLRPSPSQFEPFRHYRSNEFFDRAADMARFRLTQAAEYGDDESGG